MASHVELFCDCRCELGESPVWLEKTAQLAWIDAVRGEVLVASGNGYDVQKFAIPGTSPAGMVMDTIYPECLLVSRRMGIGLLDLKTGNVKEIAHPAAELPHLFYNDGKIDPLGRLWVGTAETNEKDPRGILFRLDGDGEHIADAGFAVCNGPAFSVDGKTLYLSDSIGRRIFTYDVDSNGRLLNRKQLIAFAPDMGLPDGLTTSVDGSIWVAFWGGGCVRRFSPAGELLEQIQVPAPNTTSLTFGGSDLSTLFVTTARDGLNAQQLEASPLSGNVFKIKTSFKGWLSPPYQV